jgi:hypothetical protein
MSGGLRINSAREGAQPPSRRELLRHEVQKGKRPSPRSKRNAIFLVQMHVTWLSRSEITVHYDNWAELIRALLAIVVQWLDSIILMEYSRILQGAKLKITCHY